MDKGIVILLNGVSSSGKTTIAKRMQDKSKAHLAWLSSDTFCNMWPEKILDDNFMEIYMRIQTVMYQTIKLFADSGIDVVVDTVLLAPYNALEDLIPILRNSSVMLVHVVCSIEELRRREIERGDRLHGQAESQLQYLIPQDTYDLTVDTSLSSSDDCADRIIESSKCPNQWNAFKKLCAQISL